MAKKQKVDKADVGKKLEQILSDDLDVLKERGIATDERKEVLEEVRVLHELYLGEKKADEDESDKIERRISIGLRTLEIVVSAGTTMMSIATASAMFSAGMHFEATGLNGGFVSNKFVASLANKFIGRIAGK